MQGKKKALIVDIDGTVFRWHLIFLWLRVLAETYDHIREMLESAAPELAAHRARKASFQAYVSKITQLFWFEKRYVGISRADSLRAAEVVVQNGRDHLYVFSRELIAAAQNEGWMTFAISGSPQEAVDLFTKSLKIDHALGTIHPLTEEGLFADLPTIDHVSDKGATLLKLATEYNIDLVESVAMGDTALDASMLDAVGWPICFNPSRELRLLAKQKQWGIVVERKDSAYILSATDPDLNHLSLDLESVLPIDLAFALQQRLEPGFLF
jgi:phosphoserine phosphatase